MTVFVYSLKYQDAAEMFASFANLRYSQFLDSSMQNQEYGRYSFIVFKPIEIIESKNGIITVTNKDQQLSFRGDPFQILQERLDIYRISDEEINRANLPPFQGGALGMFGYDLVRGIEHIAPFAEDNSAFPDLCMGIYDHVISFDHLRKHSWYIVHAENESEARKHRTQLEKMLSLPVSRKPENTEFSPTWSSNATKESYLHKVRKVQEYIKNGDVFQANISQRFKAELPADFDPYAHYCKLRKTNPACFSGYMNFGDIKISSSSPERFLKVHNRKVETKPIKGTMPRGSTEEEDKINIETLCNSSKDLSENVMIVDLMRNDLSKICEEHSVSVKSLCDIESYAGVHHLVSTLTANLKADRTSLELFKSCFPAGSITGCPKIRSMEIIEELEPERRGAYCGNIGYIDFEGNMDSSVVIRTLVYNESDNGHSVNFNVGGGIIFESDAEKEYNETLDKAKSVFESFESGNKKLQKTGG